MIIKCPECGHQVSDKAPVCPSCGVEIAGKIIRCPHCGEIHFISDGICPNCHHSLTQRSSDDSRRHTLTDDVVPTPVVDNNPVDDDDVVDAPQPDNSDDSLDEEVQAAEEERPVQAIPITSSTTVSRGPVVTPDQPAKPKSSGSKPAKPVTPNTKKSRWPLVVSLIVAVGICLALLFAYNHANQNNEEREFQTAIDSRDPAILQSYLNTYPNAPTAHRDSVKALLNAIRSSDPQWDMVKSSTDVNILKEYLQKNPQSPHKQQVLDMIDELDWKAALQTHDFANYLSLHQNGKHAAEAVDSVKLTMDMPASGGDKQKAVSAVRNFLIALNSHNEERVKNCFASHLEYFNEKSSVDGDEALNYMAIIYRNAERLNWHVDNADAAKVTKTGEGAGARYSLSMPARLSVNYTSGNNVQSKYNIIAKIDGSGHITAIRLVKQAVETSSNSDSKPAASSEKKHESTKESTSSSSKKSSSKSSEKNSSDKKSTSKKSSSSKK